MSALALSPALSPCPNGPRVRAAAGGYGGLPAAAQTLMAAPGSAIPRRAAARRAQRSAAGAAVRSQSAGKRCTHIAHAAKGHGQGNNIQPGCLVAYNRGEKQDALGLVLEPHGKKNWWLQDERGHRSSVAPRSISLVLPGSDYKANDLEQFQRQAAAEGDMSLMEIAWAVASEDPRPHTLPELSTLLFDNDTAANLYVTYVMLQRDAVYFKQAKGVLAWEPRSSEGVALAVKQAAAAEALAALQRQFVADATSALRAPREQRPPLEEWLKGPHADRLLALQAVATKPQPAKPQQEAVREVLALLGRKAGGPELRQLADAAWQLLLDLGVVQLHAPLQLLRAGVDLEFPAHVEREAQALLADTQGVDADASRRRDLRHLTTFAVDDAGTSEVDDAVSWEELPWGGTKLWVHVADPTRWLTIGSGLEEEARLRQRTLYMPWGFVPMFPASLASSLFSLTNQPIAASSAAAGGGSDGEAPDTGCCAMSVGAELAPDGSLSNWEITPSLIRVTHSLTYDEADEDLLAGPEGARHPQLQQLYEAATARKLWRVAQGSIDIDVPEAKVTVPFEDLNSSAPQVAIKKISQWESPSRVLVAEMMILAGEVVGALGTAAALPLPYRGQAAPELPPEEELAELPEGPCKGYRLRRCMTRSTVEPRPSRHASLALDSYVQFTSPIRRYTDLIAHWNVKAFLRGTPAPFSASDIETITAVAAEASREVGRAEGEVTKYWVAEYLRQRWQDSWAATFLGWFRRDSQLAAVLLEELGVETILRVDLPVVPGERLSLALVEVDVAAGFFRMRVEGMLDSPVTQARAAAAAAAAAEEGAGDGEQLLGADDLLADDDMWAAVEGGMTGAGDAGAMQDALEGDGTAGMASAAAAAASAATAAGVLLGMSNLGHMANVVSEALVSA